MKVPAVAATSVMARAADPAALLGMSGWRLACKQAGHLHRTAMQIHLVAAARPATVQLAVTAQVPLLLPLGC